MSIDPRTPVIVGVGQVTNRPDPGDDETWTQPASLMARALERAAADATGDAAQRSVLLERLDELTAIPSFVWSVADPARAVTENLGIEARSTRVTFPGGTVPQTALFDSARRILAGELDVVALTGAEAFKSRDLARRRGDRAEWLTQGDDVAAAPVVFAVPDAISAREGAVGLGLPIHTYALFEHARRRANGLSRPAHVASLGSLAARMSGVAATNEQAWLRDAVSPEEATTPGPTNRMVSLPYTKLLTSNVVVDMGAAILLCSLEAARSAGVPDDRLVFPVRGAAAKEQWLVSTRDDLSRSLAMHACVRRLFGERAPSFDDVAHVDLYSCFPIAVQMAGDALGFDVRRDSRPPTVTGGMTFFGGPGNNYVTHSLATMVDVLRADPGTTGLVTGLGWYASTHSWGTYATTPPGDAFSAVDVQADVDAVALRDVDEEFEGAGEVESYTVAHDRDGGATRAIASVLTPSGARHFATCEDPDGAAAFEAADPLGETVSVADGLLKAR